MLELIDLISGGISLGVPGQTVFTGFQKRFGSFVVHGLRYALSAT